MSAQKRKRAPRLHPSVVNRFVQTEREADPAVREALRLSPMGKPTATLGNATVILDLDPDWAGRLRYDEHAEAVRVDGQKATDNDESKASVWIERVYDVGIASKTVGEAMRTVAMRHRYHPVRDYLRGLEWDGVHRLRGWVQVYLGCEQGALASNLGLNWMIQAVARVMKPGCQAKSMLILAGRQDAGKSKALRTLAGDDWFSSTRLNLANKDSFGQLEGVWVQEIEELEGFRGRSANAVKAFISSQVDKYRPAYGRNFREHRRDCVFAGTTNEDVFLEDHTGSCRFWPLTVGVIDIEALARDRDQLWAEAVELYDRGERWWLDAEDAKRLGQHNEDYQDAHPWESRLIAYVSDEGIEFLGVGEALDALGVPVERHLKASRELRKCMARMGWKAARRRVDGVPTRGFVPRLN